MAGVWDMITILQGDVVEQLKTLPGCSVQCVVTSPPYYGLRDYGIDGQIGLEETPEKYVQKIVEVFREVKRVLRDDGTLWLNLGDSYSGSKGNGYKQTLQKTNAAYSSEENYDLSRRINRDDGDCKPKDLLGIPWMVAFALRADDWYLRSDIIWSKPNPMPESVTDRPTKAHEYIFLLTKNSRYYYDSDAIREECSESYINDKRPPGILRQRFYENSKYNQNNYGQAQFSPEANERVTSQLDRDIALGHKKKQDQTGNPTYTGFNERWKNRKYDGEDTTRGGNGTGLKGHSGGIRPDGTTVGNGITRNRRTVWEIATQPTPEAHFATFPEALVEPCIKAGTSERGCCPVCGAAWERMVEKGCNTGIEGKQDNSNATLRHDGLKHSGRIGETPIKTTGWQSSCKCGRNDTVPCVVLDPFGGSGTTAKVARDLKRDCILIEINPAYISIAKEKLRLNEQLVI